ncbi:hypothetical protein [Pedosphaera parvula]|uniref:Lipoprotein n=1 Tax=Pedosphaera parvula (strain Ellin514) TaxID=320771 RepID=B9XSQ8_PEDPL|nr:hypothetical protein [Pedosphaera parvula]EEF57110.1 hypothetical protein Cflav_PD0150 [Pedosphaera parvula Ellin514]
MQTYFINPIFRAVVAIALCLTLTENCSFAIENDKPGPLVVQTGKDDGCVYFWLETSLKRVFPHSQPGNAHLRLLAARNGKIAFQACLKSHQLGELTAECRVEGAEGFKPRIRYVGFVPMHHLTPNTALSELDGVDQLPGLVPDPLFPFTKVTSIGPGESRSFWITLNIPADAKPGLHEFKVHLSSNNGKQSWICLYNWKSANW